MIARPDSNIEMANANANNADMALADDSCSIIACLAQLEKDMYDQSCRLEGMLSEFSDQSILVEDCTH